MSKKIVRTLTFLLVLVFLFSNNSFSYSGVTNDVNINYYATIGISIAFVLIGLVLWLLFGRDKTVVDAVEFYPPEGYNSAEVSFFYKGYVDNKAVVSLLIYLASK